MGAARRVGSGDFHLRQFLRVSLFAAHLVRTLIQSSLYYTTSAKDFTPNSPQLYNPYPNYESAEYKARYKGNYVSCVGPRGKRLNESSADWLHGYVGKVKDYPEATLGSNNLIGLDQDVCFDRFGRQGAYGMEHDAGGSISLTEEVGTVAWENVDWYSLQQQCIQENRDRFDFTPRIRPDEQGYQMNGEPEQPGKISKKRTAVLIRGYQDMDFYPELSRMIRSVVMELGLGTGGEYEVFLLYNIKGLGKPIDSLSESEQRAIIDEKIPAEFRNITILWNEMLWPSRYPLLPEEARVVHVSQWLPVQWFAKQRPEFDFYWNWEMDVRYSGHAYDFVTKTTEWARKQPRKGLWERNSRFYIPSYHDRNFTLFSDAVESRYPLQVQTHEQDGLIWGPFPPRDVKTKSWDVKPPTKLPNDEWGVGEEADFITYLPMFEPSPTHYSQLGAWYNYDEKLRGNGGPNRRATIITFNRLSHRLISMMDLENLEEPGHHMGSEQWGQAVSMHHGLKAVYVPQAVYMSKKWPAKAAEFIFNNGDDPKVLEKFQYLPRTGSGSGGTDSCFGLGREFPFFNLSSYYYRAKLGANLYRWFLGQAVDGIGGETVRLSIHTLSAFY
jgi:hypothetical protein